MTIQTQPIALVFGTGRLVVSAATSSAMPDAHLVIINPAVKTGPVGEHAHEREARSTFHGDEIVLAFPTSEQADRVANALCNVSIGAPAVSPEARRWADARGAVVNLSVNAPDYRQKLNALSEAEDALFLAATRSASATSPKGCGE